MSERYERTSHDESGRAEAGAMAESTDTRSASAPSEEHIRGLLARLGRPHPSGGTVIERAALMAEGAAFDATMAWILAHGGQPEATVGRPARRGLYGPASDARSDPAPRRFVLPAGALARAARDAPEG